MHKQVEKTVLLSCMAPISGKGVDSMAVDSMAISVHPKGADSMAASGLRFGNTLVGSEWATAVLPCTNGLRKQSSCTAPISSREACIIPVWASDYDYCQLVNGWVWFESQTCRGWLYCKSTCVEFGD